MNLSGGRRRRYTEGGAVWTTFPCIPCHGTGLVQAFDGGPKECLGCKGKGFMFISENDRVAFCPGGPLDGTWPGKFEELADFDRPVAELWQQKEEVQA